MLSRIGICQVKQLPFENKILDLSDPLELLNQHPQLLFYIFLIIKKLKLDFHSK